MDTELSKDDREKLYPHFGLLWPEGSAKLAKAESKQMVREICDIYAVRRQPLSLSLRHYAHYSTMTGRV